MEAPRVHAWGAFVAFGILLFVAIAAPAVALIYAWTANEGAATTNDEVAPYALDRSPRSVTVNATAVPAWREGTNLLAPSWDGIVTALPLAPGDSIENGKPVAYINGVEVRFYLLGTPIFQTVCTSDTVLVPEIRTILQSAGFTVGTAPSLSWTDVKAIRAYARLIGAPGASSTTCFDPGWVISAPQGISEIGEITLIVGALAPPVGEEVFVGLPVLESFALTGGTGSPSIDKGLNPGGADVYESSELLIAGAPTGVGLEDLEDPDALASVAPLLDRDAESVGIAVRLTLRDSQYIVPPTALVGLTSNATCVEPIGGGPPVAVVVIGSSAGGVVVDFGTNPAPTHIRPDPVGTSCA